MANLKKFDASPDIIYSITKVLNKDYQKINPNFFSKFCGTTGLLVFFVKDVLDYLGLSFDKRSAARTLISVKSLLTVINSKLYRLKELLQKYYNINI